MSVNLIVIVREVWDTRDLAGSVLDESGGLKAGLLATRMEPEDLNSLDSRISQSRGSQRYIFAGLCASQHWRF